MHIASDTEVLELFNEFRSDKSLWWRLVSDSGLIEEVRFRDGIWSGRGRVFRNGQLPLCLVKTSRTRRMMDLQ